MKPRHLLAIAALATMASSTATAADQSFGVWRNPSNSVHVKAEPCADRMCGVVIWANDKAKADARRGGTKELVGSELFRDFRQQKPGLWRGKVFVPDICKTFSGTIRIVDPDTLEGKGCLLGRVGCKSQVWRRLKD